MTPAPTLDHPIELALESAALTSIEIAADAARAALPEPLDPVEVRPGVSLASLLVFQVAPGLHAEFGDLPAYSELILAFQVLPALGRRLPRMAFYVANMATSLARAGEFLETVHWIPTSPAAIRVEIFDGGRQVRAFDEQGPIVEIANTHPAPVFKARHTLGQVFTRRDGRIAFYHELLTGPVHEHQTRHAHIALSDHPFLAPLGGPIRAPRVYLQMSSQPGATIRQSAERPRWLR